MEPFVAIAFDQEGVQVTPTCPKEQGPFTCVKCNDKLTLKQGAIKNWHFAHARANPSDCDGGGESSRLVAAKITLVEHIRSIRFVATCKNGKHKLEREYCGCTAAQESASADVSVFNNGTLKAMVQVKAETDAARQSIESRAVRVGAANVWDVCAMDVVRLQTDLHRDSAVMKLDASNARECVPCTEAEAAKASAAAKKKRSAEEKAVVEIIDDDTIRRNGVLMKKKHLPAVCVKSCYTWIEAQEECVPAAEK